MAIVFILFRGNNGLGKGFGVAVMYIYTRNVALAIGALTLLLRTLRLVNNANFFYILFGTLNLCIAVVCLVLYFLERADMQWLNKCLLNMLVGFVVIADVCFFKHQTNSHPKV